MTRHEPTSSAKQSVKERLLCERFAGLDLATFRDDLHMVDARHPDRLRVQLRDESWLEYRDSRIGLFGPEGRARALAGALAAHLGLDPAEAVGRDVPTARAARPPARGRRQALTEEQRDALADSWRARGYADVTVDGASVWVHIAGHTRLRDESDRVTVYGPATDDAVRALVEKARDDWGAKMFTFGDDSFRARVWLEAQRQGVEVVGYTPPLNVLRAWEREQASRGRAESSSVAALALTAAPGPRLTRGAQERAVRAYVVARIERRRIVLTGIDRCPPAIIAGVNTLNAAEATDFLEASLADRVEKWLPLLQERGAAAIAADASAARPTDIAFTVAPAVAVAEVTEPEEEPESPRLRRG